MSDITTQELLATQRELIEAQRDLIEALKKERNRQPAQAPAYTWTMPAGGYAGDPQPNTGGWPLDMRPTIICGGTGVAHTSDVPSPASLLFTSGA